LVVEMNESNLALLDGNTVATITTLGLYTPLPLLRDGGPDGLTHVMRRHSDLLRARLYKTSPQLFYSETQFTAYLRCWMEEEHNSVLQFGDTLLLLRDGGMNSLAHVAGFHAGPAETDAMLIVLHHSS